MAFCTNCGAKLEDGVRFCTNCGAPVEPPATPDDNGFQDGLDSLDETTYVEGEATRIVSSSGAASGPDPSETAYIPTPQDAPSNLPPSMPPQYPEQPQPQPPAPRRRMGAFGIVAITLSVVSIVLVVAFGIFYFTNPLGLTDGIFADSAAAQAAAAEEAQAQADEAQQQLEEAQEQAEKIQSENEELQKQLEEANKQDSSSGTIVVVPGGSAGGTTSTGGDGFTITAPSGYPSVRVGNSGEVLAGSDTRTITNADIADMNDWELCVARNEIIARHGYPFKRDDLREFFANMPWYSPDPSYTDGRVSKLEWDNMNTILDLEHARGSQYTED